MTRRFALAVAVWLAAAPGAAHHGAFQYEFGRTVQVEGEVTEYHWRNPHAFVYLRTRDADGTEGTFVIEAEGPSGLTPLGVNAQSIRPGDYVVAVVFPHRSDPHAGLGRELIKADGEVVPLHPRFVPPGADRATGVATGLGGTWVPHRTDFFAHIAERASWPLTPESRAAARTIDVAQSPQANCVALSAPVIMLYPTVHTIELRDDRLLMDADYLGARRTVYLDGRPHPPADQVSVQGHSTGRWEDAVLVVDTRNFSAGAYGLSFGVPGSAARHLVERLQLSGDGTELLVEYRLEDPENLSRPVSGRYRWTYRPDLRPSGVPCDLATARHFLETRAVPPPQ